MHPVRWVFKFGRLLRSSPRPSQDPSAGPGTWKGPAPLEGAPLDGEAPLPEALEDVEDTSKVTRRGPSPRPTRPFRLDSEPLTTPVPPLASVRVQRISIVVVALLSFLAAAWVASALWAGLLLGVLVAFVVEPAHRRLLVFWPRRRTLVAGLTVSGVALSAGGIAAGIGYIVVNELMGSLAALQGVVMRLLGTAALSESAAERLARVGVTPELLSERALRLSERVADWGSSFASQLLGSTVHAVAGAFIALVTAFYALKDRRPLERRLELILPLHPRITRELVGEFRAVGRGTLTGSVFAGLVQGVFAAVGYALVGVPRALLLGVLTAVASFIPVVGTMLIWVPVGVILIVNGRPVAGIVELLWGVVVTTSLVDYVLRPMLVGKESRAHPLLFLVGLIGGVEVLGGVGIVAGPIIMALFASVLRVYRREVVEPLRAQSR